MGHLRSFFGVFSYLPVLIARYDSLSLNESDAQQFLSSQGMFEIDNYQSSLLELQSVSWSLAEFRHNKIVQSPHENYFNVC